MSVNSSVMERGVLENVGIFLHDKSTQLVTHRVRCIMVLRKCNWTGKGRVRGKALCWECCRRTALQTGKEIQKDNGNPKFGCLEEELCKISLWKCHSKNNGRIMKGAFNRLRKSITEGFISESSDKRQCRPPYDELTRRWKVQLCEKKKVVVI